jgi:hypothetical protein
MQPFLPSAASWHHSHRTVPGIDIVDDTENLHPREAATLSALRLALDDALKVFGKYQLSEMLYEEALEIHPALNSHYPLICRDGTVVSAQASPYCHTVRNDVQRVYTHVEVWAKRKGVRLTDEPQCMSAHELMALLEEHGGVLHGHLPPLDFGRAPDRRKRSRDGDMVDFEFRKARKEHNLPYTKEFKGTLDSKWSYKDFSFPPETCSVIQTPGIRLEGIRTDGTGLATSRIRSVTFNNGVHILQTKNSFYAAFEENRKRVHAAVRATPAGGVTLSVVPSLVPIAPDAKHFTGL